MTAGAGSGAAGAAAGGAVGVGATVLGVGVTPLGPGATPLGPGATLLGAGALTTGFAFGLALGAAFFAAAFTAFLTTLRALPDFFDFAGPFFILGLCVLAAVRFAFFFAFATGRFFDLVFFAMIHLLLAVDPFLAMRVALKKSAVIC